MNHDARQPHTSPVLPTPRSRPRSIPYSSTRRVVQGRWLSWRIDRFVSICSQAVLLTGCSRALGFPFQGDGFVVPLYRPRAVLLALHERALVVGLHGMKLPRCWAIRLPSYLCRYRMSNVNHFDSRAGTTRIIFNN